MSQWAGGAAAVQMRMMNSSVTMMESCWTGSQSDAAWTETILSSTGWSWTTLEYIFVWRKLDRGFGTSLTWLCQVIRDVYQIGSSSTLTRCCNILANVHVRYLLSSVCRLTSATLVRPTQAVEIFGNISTAFGTLAIRWHPQKILRRSSQGSPLSGDFGHIERYISETVQDKR